jgi:hypothetical protein
VPADPIKIQVTGPDGKTFETDLPQGFVPVTHVERDYVPRSTLDTALDQARASAVADINAKIRRGELAPELKDQALRAWGITPPAGNGGGAGGGAGGAGGAGGGAGGAVDERAIAERIRADVLRETEEQTVKPLREANEAAMTRIAAANQLTMERAVVDAALEMGVDPDLCRSIGGDVPEIVKLLSGQVAFDEESGRAFAADPGRDEFRISGRRRAEGEPPYMTVPELVQDWLKTHPRYAAPTRQRGAQFGQPGQGGGGAGNRTRVIQGGNSPEAAREIGRNLEAVASGEVVVHMPGVPE